MYKIKFFIPIFIGLFINSSIFATIYDNRFFPLYKRPFTKKNDKYSRFGTTLFIDSADSAMGMHSDVMPIPKMYGEYLMQNIGKALVVLGKENPLLDEFQNENFPWDIYQQLNSQGVNFIYDQHIYKYLYAGASLLFMRVNSNYSFIFNKGQSSLNKTGTGFNDIYGYMSKLHNAIGVTGNSFNKLGFGDMDAYIRIGNVWDYLYKMQRIDAGFSLGFLIPTGQERCLNLPSSVPFGGDGFWGMYGQIDTELGLRDDMKLLLMLRLSKRKTEDRIMRVPVAQEHPLFGALVTPVRVDPGYTVIFAPQFWWENLRKGFGVRVGYTLAYHSCDKYCDIRSESAKNALPADFGILNNTSSWGNDYLNLSGYYEFYDEVDNKKVEPIISLSWDWPTFFLVGKNAPKTQSVSLGLDLVF